MAALPERLAVKRLALLVACYLLALGAAFRTYVWTPPIIDATEPLIFSETRARQHVAVLTQKIGLRSVGTPGLQAAHSYVWAWAQQLRDDAQEKGLIVEIAWEGYTGSTEMSFAGERFLNAWNNISNIVVHISAPCDSGEPDCGRGSNAPAVMLVAHHDSPVGSLGAGDDASNVGVMMELARTLVAGGPTGFPAAPVMLLFSGAEEPLCQSAAAFTQASPWAQRAGVFINLESIGPGGAPIVFQHADAPPPDVVEFVLQNKLPLWAACLSNTATATATAILITQGAWTIEAFARGARYPRGAISAQDVFDWGLVLGDTDYRQLSYLHSGGLPGIDISYLLGGKAYHTDRDTLEAIPSGVLQETGETLLGALRSLSSALAAAAAESPQALQELLSPRDHKRLFVSLGAHWMFTYSTRMADRLHNVPLLLAFALPWALALLTPRKALPPGQGLRLMLQSAAAAGATLVGALAVPAVLGACRALLSGHAMVWFARPLLGYAIYLPAAAAVLLLPWINTEYDCVGTSPLAYHMGGAALLNAAVAAALTRAGVGMALLFAAWAGGGAAAALAIGVAGGPTPLALACVVAVLAAPVCMCAESAMGTMIILTSRMSLTGHVPALGDAVPGVLLGLGVASLGGLVVPPLTAALLGKRAARRATLGLAVLALTAAVASSMPGIGLPYSPAAPKRVMLGHVHFTEPVLKSSNLSGVALPPGGGATPQAPPLMQVVNSTYALGGCDSTPVSGVVAAMGFDPKDALPPAAGGSGGGAWDLIYPVSRLLDVALYPAPSAVGVVDVLPHVRVLSRKVLLDHLAGGSGEGSSAGGGGGVELVLEVFSEKPCWGTLRLTPLPGGGITGWAIHDNSDDDNEDVGGGAAWTSASDFLAAGQQRGSGDLMLSARGAAAAAPASSSSSSSGSSGRDAGGGSNNDALLQQPLTVRFTNELQEGPLHWRMRLHIKPPPSPSPGTGDAISDALALHAELHVGYVWRTPALIALLERLPEWATPSFESTTYISSWDF